jgi:four helix bundle protein
MMVGMMRFEKLKAWQCSHRLVLEVYRATEAWPPRELYGLTSQVRRAAVSVAANIAEGSGKRGAKEFGRYLDTALGSFSELTYLLRLSLDLHIMGSEDWEHVEPVRCEAGKLVWGLYRRIRPGVGITRPA